VISEKKRKQLVLGAVRAELGLVVAVVGWTVVFCVVNAGFGAV